MSKLTYEFLEKLKKSDGSFNQKYLHYLGIKPEDLRGSNWQENFIGRYYSDELLNSISEKIARYGVEKVISSKKHHKLKKKSCKSKRSKTPAFKIAKAFKNLYSR